MCARCEKIPDLLIEILAEMAAKSACGRLELNIADGKILSIGVFRKLRINWQAENDKKKRFAKL